MLGRGWGPGWGVAREAESAGGGNGLGESPRGAGEERVRGERRGAPGARCRARRGGGGGAAASAAHGLGPQPARL